MSGLPTINVVDDEQMSSEGSVNAPVAPPRSPSVHSARATSPIEPVDLHTGRTSPVDKGVQSDIIGRRGSSIVGTIPSTEVLTTQTVPVDVPTRAETEKAFAEVSSALQGVSSQHEEVRAGMQSLASGVETLRRARVADVETTAQVQATLQRTLSASSSLEARLEQAQSQQTQAKVAADEARIASERALQQAARLREEQSRTAKQLEETLSAQAVKAQESIAEATQYAMHTAKDVKGLADVARKAEYTAQVTAAKMEEQVAQLQQQMLEQRALTAKEVQSSQEVQAKISQQLADAQKVAQSTMGITQTYEKQLADVTAQMKALEQIVISQRVKGNALESQLSASQDRIGGAERRARELQTENESIKSELKYWNELYSQETGTTYEQEEESHVVASLPTVSEEVPVPLPVTVPDFADVKTPPPESSMAPWLHPLNSSVTVPTPRMGVLSGVSAPLLGSFVPSGSPTAGPVSEMFGTWNTASGSVPPPMPTPQRSRRESFGSTFAGSSGTGGNGGGNGNVTSTGPVQRMTTTSTFNIEIKPKEPPIFRGTANEDVDTWLAKVSDFIYLTEANTRQQVAYMATLLQDAAADWWAALIKERGGSRPVDFGEMSALMQKRFGSTMRVDRARAALRNVRQMQNETVRAYGTRFEALLSKLPSFDMEWAKSQFIWGLNQRIAELVVLAEPADLSIAIQKAEKIEMARGTVSHPSVQSSGSWTRGSRGWYSRGRGRFGAIQQAPGPMQHQPGQGSQTNAAAVQQSGQPGPRPNRDAVQCYKCQGWGHFSSQCPSRNSVRNRGGRNVQYTRGRRSRGQRGRGRTSTHASLTASGSGASAPPPQVADAAPVPACGMLPGKSDRNVVHYTGYNAGTQRHDNRNWNERK